MSSDLQRLGAMREYLSDADKRFESLSTYLANRCDENALLNLSKIRVQVCNVHGMLDKLILDVLLRDKPVIEPEDTQQKGE